MIILVIPNILLWSFSINPDLKQLECRLINSSLKMFLPSLSLHTPCSQIPSPPILRCVDAQLCLTLCHPMDYTVHAILQARILECVAFPFSRGDLPNPGLLHYRQILYQLSHKGRPSVFTRDIIPLEEKVFIIEGY